MITIREGNRSSPRLSVAIRWFLIFMTAFSACATSRLEEMPAPSRSALSHGMRVDPNTVDVEPMILSMKDPDYPDRSRENGEEGRVLLDVFVDESGHVTDVHVTASVSPLLDSASIVATRTAVFKPALRRGTPVAVWIHDFPIEYRLHN